MNKMEMDFAGQYVLVTGGTRGIGKITAELFRNHGATLLITGTSESCPKALQQGWNNDFYYIQGNFSTNEGIMAFLSQLDRFPRIDVCVNNAGINRIHLIHDISDRDYEEVISVNMHAPFKICRYLAGRMKQQQYGRIINVASIWSSITKPGRTMYSISKNALVGLTKTLAVEMAAYGVMVNAISPGFTATELTESTLSAAEMDQLAQQVPAKRFAQPVEMARMIVFLGSRENSYMTGQNIIVDGGFTNV